MRLQGGHVFHVPREAIWDCLFDPARLARALPGCQRFEPTGPNTYAVELRISLAVLTGRYQGTITVDEAVAPQYFTLRAEGSGPGGRVRGGGRFDLELLPTPADAGAVEVGCSLRYDGQVEFSGLLKILGAQVVSPAARAVIDRFFGRLEAEIVAHLAQQR